MNQFFTVVIYVDHVIYSYFKQQRGDSAALLDPINMINVCLWCN